jgi:hypothetical protein
METEGSLPHSQVPAACLCILFNNSYLIYNLILPKINFTVFYCIYALSIDPSKPFDGWRHLSNKESYYVLCDSNKILWHTFIYF